jgi:hypothetical protein
MTNRFKINFLLAWVIAICAVPALSKADAPTPSGTTVLSGHEKKMEDLVTVVPDIVIAKFTSLGNGSDDAPGATFFEKAGIEIVSSLKGSLSGDLQAGYSVKLFPPSKKETMPVIGTPYIMFIQKLGPTEYEIKKILPATDDNIARVKGLISAK